MSAPDLDGRTIIVTGGNSGIGKEAAVELTAMGATVVVAARNRAKGEAAVAEIKSRSGHDTVELADLDLASSRVDPRVRRRGSSRPTTASTCCSTTRASRCASARRPPTASR